MSQRFDFIKTRLTGLYEIRRKPIADNRGFFTRFFCAEEFKEVGLDRTLAQLNHTLTKEKGAIRGIHFQYPPHTETKIVSCMKGEVLDIAVDLRRNSPTFLKWHSVILSASQQNALYIPDGFAHGFQTLTENCELLYMHTQFFTPGAEGALNAFDPSLGIEWPLPVTNMSERDKNHPLIDKNFNGVEL